MLSEFLNSNTWLPCSAPERIINWLYACPLFLFHVILLKYSLVCSFLIMSLSNFDIRKCWSIELVRKYSLCFYLLREVIENWCDFFLKCLIELTSKPFWTWCFLFQRFLIIDSISLIDIGQFNCVFLFCVFWQIVSFKEFVHLICVIKFGSIELCIVFFDCTLISIKSAVILPLSFLIIVIFVFFFLSYIKDIDFINLLKESAFGFIIFSFNFLF